MTTSLQTQTRIPNPLDQDIAGTFLEGIVRGNILGEEGETDGGVILHAPMPEGKSGSFFHTLKRTPDRNLIFSCYMGGTSHWDKELWTYATHSELPITEADLKNPEDLRLLNEAYGEQH